MRIGSELLSGQRKRERERERERNRQTDRQTDRRCVYAVGEKREREERKISVFRGFPNRVVFLIEGVSYQI